LEDECQVRAVDLQRPRGLAPDKLTLPVRLRLLDEGHQVIQRAALGQKVVNPSLRAVRCVRESHRIDGGPKLFEQPDSGSLSLSDVGIRRDITVKANDDIPD